MARVIEQYDFTQCELPAALFDIRVHQKDIDSMVHKAAEHFLSIENEDNGIFKGDIVAVSLRSSDPFYCSECERFTVGKGFFSVPIEDSLIGRRPGECYSLSVDGSAVEITVLWDKRRIVPELTDEMAAHLGIDDVSTRDEYIAYATAELENKDKEKKQNAIWLLVQKEMLAKSSFEFESGEIDAQFEKDCSYLRSELGDDFEEFMHVKYHGKNPDESLRNFRFEIEKTLKTCAIAQSMAEDEGVSWSRAEYEATIDDMVNEQYTKEELEASMSYEDFVRQQQENYLREKVLSFFDGRFTLTVTD